MTFRTIACAAVFAVLAGLRATPTPPLGTHRLLVDFPFKHMPRHLWARELVWLNNVGVPAIAADDGDPEFTALAAQAGIQIAQPEFSSVRVSSLDPNALVKSRSAVHNRQQVVWTDVETMVTPVFKRGAVALEGAENPALQSLRREALLWKYWSAVLLSEGAEDTKVTGLELDEQRSTGAASAVHLLNSSGKAWRGPITAGIGSIGRKVVIADVTVPAHDSLLLPVDVSFSDPKFCRFCSGMSNSERLLYATAELTGIEYENGILSFEFFAPVAGSAVLQLERQPEGPMLAGGHLIEFDWDPDAKRVRLPIPAGAGADRRMRVAIAITGPDHVASFVDAHVMVIGQTNHIVTEYSPGNIAARSRLVLPDGWSATDTEEPGKVKYAIDVPGTRLHGEHADLRIETDGLAISHARVQLLSPVSIHVAEAEQIHFGSKWELKIDPPLITVEAPSGRNIAVQLKNNAPEIRTFQVEMKSDGLEFSPEKTEVTIGASMEREVSIRVFSTHATTGLHHASVVVSGAASLEKSVRFIVMSRGSAVSYTTNLLDAATEQSVWENTRLRAVFSKSDGGRWLEFYWKPSGRSLLPAEGVAIAKPVRIELHGDDLVLTGAAGLPVIPVMENVSVSLKREGLMTTYHVAEHDTASTATKP